MSRYDYHRHTIGENYKPKKKKNKLSRSLFFLVVFTFIIALFIYVFPEVEVNIAPETETVENNFEVIVDSNIEQVDEVNNKFPGRVVKVEDSLSEEFASTGEKNVGEKAFGEVVFFNQTGLVQPLTVENSLVTDDGIVFYVKNNVSIPKAEVSAEGNIVYGNISVSVVASEAGEEGNILPGRLTIVDLPYSKQNKIYGEVKSPFNGGTSEVIRVVSEKDLKDAESNILEKLRPRLKNKINQQLNDGLVFNDDLIEYETLAVEKAVELEEEIDKFNMKVVASAKVLVWDSEGIKRMIMEKIRKSNQGDKKLIETSSDVFEVAISEFDLEKGSAKLDIKTVNQISLPIDIDNIKQELRGLTEFEARRLLLAKDNIKDVWFKFRYSITSKIPSNINRIIIKLNI